MEEKEIQILEQILGNYIVTIKRKSSGKELNFLCPFPNCNKHKKKLAISKEKGSWHCWSCGRKGLNPDYLVFRFGSSEHKKSWGETVKQVDFNLLEQFLFPKEEIKEKVEQLKLPEQFISLVGNYSLTSLAARNYLKSRNVTEKDINYWKMGFCLTGRYSNKVVLPSFDFNGNLNFFVARAYDNAGRKYDNPPISKKEIIFNELMIDFEKPISLVEGPFDSLIAGENSVPLLGSTLNEDDKLFQKIVKNKTEVYSALDPDAKKKENLIIEKLKKYNVAVKKVNVEPYKDVGSMTKEEYQERKKAASVIQSDNFLQSILQEM
jgi:DNA primase